MSLAQLYISNTYDAEHLYGVLRETVYGIGCGKTFSKLMLMLGEVHLGDKGNIYVYIGENLRHVETVEQDFMEILKHDKVQYEACRNCIKITTSEQMFIFLAIGDDIVQNIQGIKVSRAFVDVSFYTRKGYADELRYVYSREDN